MDHWNYLDTKSANRYHGPIERFRNALGSRDMIEQVLKKTDFWELSRQSFFSPYVDQEKVKTLPYKKLDWNWWTWAPWICIKKEGAARPLGPLLKKILATPMQCIGELRSYETSANTSLLLVAVVVGGGLGQQQQRCVSPDSSLWADTIY